MTASPIAVSPLNLEAGPTGDDVRWIPAPDREPPYDDEAAFRSGSWQPRGYRSGSPPGLVQGTLALAFVLPSGLDAMPDITPDLRLLPERAAADLVDEEEFGPQPTRRRDLPCPRKWAATFVQAVVETLAGGRPAAQLVRWTTRDVYDALAARIMIDTSATRPVVRSVHVTEPADGIAEVAALVRRGARCTAVALRLEGLDGRWQCSALELG